MEAWGFDSAAPLRWQDVQARRRREVSHGAESDPVGKIKSPDRLERYSPPPRKAETIGPSMGEHGSQWPECSSSWGDKGCMLSS